MEVWRPILEYENYEVSNMGKVKNVKTDKTLTAMDCRGYSQVGLYNKGRKYFLVHRLVLQSFLPNDDDKLECNHKNHIKTDNRLENLEWVSKSQNTRFRKKWKSSSTYKGVSWNKRDNVWQVNCNIDGKKIYIGLFHNEEEAAKAYDNFVIKHNLQHYTILNNL
jgi:hypothetical protein